MKVFVVFAHPEPESFNGAMFRAAMETLLGEGHEVETSDLYQMDFDAVSGRHNFTTVKDPNYSSSKWRRFMRPKPAALLTT